MRAAVAAGAGMVNDVMALQANGALAAAAELAVPVCLMHMQGSPRTMQADPQYDDVVAEVGEFLNARVGAAIEAGVVADNILLDPGFCFGKTLAHNYALLSGLERLRGDFPLLVGMSRKSMLGNLLGKPVDQRLHAGLAAATIAVMKGAAIVRTHDVAETVDALKVCAAAKPQNN
jgi:dihydropteroate synthase